MQCQKRRISETKIKSSMAGGREVQEVKQITTTVGKRKQFRVYKHKMGRLANYKFTKSKC